MIHLVDENDLVKSLVCHDFPVWAVRLVSLPKNLGGYPITGATVRISIYGLQSPIQCGGGRVDISIYVNC